MAADRHTDATADWARVKTIAGDAWSLPAGERTAFILSACGDDGILRREVSSLVAAMAAAENLFETPAVLPAADLAAFTDLTGRRVGPYEILSRLGAGGMGEVYKARDTRLDRTVAIKVLTPHATVDPASRDRMAREARAIAALNDPHICTLFDIGHQDGLDFLVMEYIDGETLAERLSRGLLPIDAALSYAEQIAGALMAAHRAGIVHRDVKPGNIMLTAAGRAANVPVAKLLDFGLAKANPPDAPSRLSAPPVALDLTVPGIVPGTAQYMAPEQIERNAIDVRTDVFAFGGVIFEMLTGRKAFPGANRDDVLIAILHGERPKVSAFRPEAPPAFDRLVRNCLAPRPGDRYQSFEPLLEDLRVVRARLDSRRRQTLAVAAAFAAVCLIAVWLMWPANLPTASPAPSLTRLPASVGVLGAAALSPDGSTLVFSWIGDGFDNPEIVLLPIGATSRIRLTHDPGVEEWPVWSPDGTHVAFVRCDARRCAIVTTPARGGAERVLIDVPRDRYYGLAWSPDGRFIAYAERASPSEPYALFLLSPDTLSKRRLTTPATTGLGELRFAFSPDSQTVAIIRVERDVGVYLIATATGVARTVLRGQHEWFGGIAWTTDGRHLILSANQQGIRRLWKLSTAGGELEQLAIGGQDAYHPSVPQRGDRLAFVHELRDWDLATMSLEHYPYSTSPFASSTKPDLDPAFAPDGRVAFVSERSGTRELWVSGASGTDARQLTSFNGSETGKPRWSPDGRFLAFHCGGIYVIAAAGGSPRRISTDGELPTWSADGEWIYFMRHVTGRPRPWKVPVQGGAATEAFAGDAFAVHELAPHEAYFAKVSGGIWRRSYDGSDDRAIVPEFDQATPGYWAVVAAGIYYAASETDAAGTLAKRLKFLDFNTGRTTSFGILPGVFGDWIGGLSVSPDRKTVLFSQRTYESREIVIVEHFR